MPNTEEWLIEFKVSITTTLSETVERDLRNKLYDTLYAARNELQITCAGVSHTSTQALQKEK
jgi:hypothetical protein